MIWRVRDRGTFEALRRDGRRARRGPVTVTYLPTGSDEAAVRVAFGVSRKVGNAVVRNRLRRQLRSIMRDLDRGPGGLAPGTYLITTYPDAAGTSYARLADQVSAACADSVARFSGKLAR